MIVTLIAPFSTVLAFDRKWMAYEQDKVSKYFQSTQSDFSSRGIQLGKSLLPILESGRFYLDTEEPGELFRGYFLAKCEYSVASADLPIGDSWLGKMVAFSGPSTVRWLDKGFGYLTVKLDLADDQLQALVGSIALATFDRAINDIADLVYSQLKDRIADVTKSLLQINYIYQVQAGSSPSNPFVSNNLHWVHKVWSPSKDSDGGLLQHIVSSATLNGFNVSRSSYWGWGDSVYIASNRETAASFEAEWERGMLLAQYFHTTLDQCIKQLPIQIERTRLLIDRGSVRQAQLDAEMFTYGVNALLTDFGIAKQLTAGGTREVMTVLIERWETDELSQGVVSLVPYLKDLISQSTETLKSWSQTSIETILFVSTVVGFFGLSIALHDYLTPTKERFDLSNLSSPHASIGDPLAIAGLFFLFSMLVFMLSKVGVILRLFRSLRFRMKLMRRNANGFGNRKSEP